MNPPEQARLKILALDAATEACSVALLQVDPLQAGPLQTAPTAQDLLVRELEPGRGASDLILPLVQEVLAEAGLALPDLSAIAFGRGPGGFTGVRLAASVAQGLAFGAGLPVIPVSDLRAVAQRVLDEIPAAAGVLVCNDARMREVYWTCCERDAGGLASEVCLEQVGPPETVQLPTTSHGSVYGAGRGFLAYPQLAERLGPTLAGLRPEPLPRAREIARLGLAQFAAGGAVPADQALPVYLRDDIARPSRN